MRPRLEARKPAWHWRAIESSALAAFFGESTIDFYGRLISPGVTARRVLARVTVVRNEARGVKSFVLKPNGHFRGFRAGQHVNLTIEIEGVRHTRCYSPSNAPDSEGTVVLTVKRHVRGRVSEWLHEHLRVDDWVELGQAFGDFTLPVDARSKLLLVAGGSGITPVASLIRDALDCESRRDLVLLGYARTSADWIFAGELRALSRRYPGLRVHFVSTQGVPEGRLFGHFSSEHLAQVAPDAGERQAFVCGPQTLIDAVRALWAERGFVLEPKTETFAPFQPHRSDGVGSSSTVRVTAARTGRGFSGSTCTPLLGQAERAGLSPPSGCRQGICFSCTCRKRSGTVVNLSTGVVSSEPEEDIRLCVSAPLSNVTLDL